MRSRSIPPFVGIAGLAVRSTACELTEGTLLILCPYMRTSCCALGGQDCEGGHTLLRLHHFGRD